LEIAMKRPHLWIGGLAGLAVSLIVSSSASQLRPPAEASLIQLDERQRSMVVSGDATGMAALAHANLRINAPTNEVLTREEFLRRIGASEIAFERLVRFPESVVITGDVGIIMGREEVTPAQGSESDRLFGSKPLVRRYTNIYVRERGRWHYLARHANVAPSK
jgi:Domain of unknown function (DUF4440)